MRYSATLNYLKMKEWGLNFEQGALMDLMQQLPSWANEMHFNGATYYFFTYEKIMEEIPFLSPKQKRDTIYRICKTLQELQLIEHLKVNGLDFWRLTQKGKEWNYIRVSDKNPSELGNPSENNSDKNPTYNIYNSDNYTNNTLSSKKPKKERDSFQKFKNKLLDVCPNFGFSLAGKLDYSSEHQGFQLKNDLIFNLQNQKFLEREESFKIWDYLFQNQSRVLELAQSQLIQPVSA